MTEASIRLGVFLGILVIMMLWELASPKRQSRHGRSRRWPANLGIVVIDSLLVRLVLPAGLVSIALWAESMEWGLLYATGLPYWANLVVAIVVLDIAIYWQHRLFHRVPLLWRLHRVHHADPDFDVTTGLRFHPLEILLSLLIKAAVVVLLGAPALAIVIFEVLLNACSLFNHGNVALPARLEAWVRKVLITQELHRIHHSSSKDETNSNYGFSVSWWDHLFGSFKGKAAAGSDHIDIGLIEYRDPKQTTRLWGLLQIPFTRAATGKAAASKQQP